MIYVVFILWVLLAALGAFHVIQQIINTKQSKKWPHYGLELLFASKKDLNEIGLHHRNRARLYFVMFLLTSYAYIYLHGKHNLQGLLPF